MDRTDLFHGHIGGIDTLARSLLVAAALVENQTLAEPRSQRYAGWTRDLGKRIRSGGETLETLEAQVRSGELNPSPVSGRQELLEERVNRVIWTSGS